MKTLIHIIVKDQTALVVPTAKLNEDEKLIVSLFMLRLQVIAHECFGGRTSGYKNSLKLVTVEKKTAIINFFKKNFDTNIIEFSNY